MANTLTNLTPDLYEALDQVSRELVGFIPAVTLDARAEMAALNQVIRVPITPASTGEDITPAATVPTTTGQAIANTSITIAKSRAFPFAWNGEEQKGMNTGVGYQNLRTQQITQAMRACVNDVEADLAGLYTKTSRAYGTAATAPFGSTPALGDGANVLRILKDNGAPEGDVHLIIDTAAGVNLRSLTQLTKANEAGNDTLLRQGVLLDVFGMQIRESAQVKAVTKGTGSGYTTSAAGFAVGVTSIPIITGTGTVLAGDVVTFAGDTNKYVVTTGVAAPGTIVIAAPGLRVAIAASATAMTIGGNYRANMAFHRSAMILVARPPAVPTEGDMALDRMVITDPRSGLSFMVAMYPGYYQVRYEIALAWGQSLIKPEHTALLLG